MVTRNNDLLMLALSRFFSNEENIQKLLQVVEGKSTVSLRLLDYFVTNFAKKHKTSIVSPVDSSVVMCVHSSYRSQLKAFSKQQFDPFRRRERIIFEFGEQKHTIETTVGQLNFFRWAIESGVLEFVIHNKDTVESDMYSNSAASTSSRDEISEVSTSSSENSDAPGYSSCNKNYLQAHAHTLNDLAGSTGCEYETSSIVGDNHRNIEKTTCARPTAPVNVISHLHVTRFNNPMRLSFD